MPSAWSVWLYVWLYMWPLSPPGNIIIPQICYFDVMHVILVQIRRICIYQKMCYGLGALFFNVHGNKIQSFIGEFPVIILSHLINMIISA